MFSGNSPKEFAEVVLRPNTANKEREIQQVHSRVDGESIRIKHLEGDHFENDTIIKTPNWSDFGKNVMQKRINAKMKQADLAKACNVKEDVIKSLEKGTPSQTNLQPLISKINRVLNLFNTSDVLKLPKV